MTSLKDNANDPSRNAEHATCEDFKNIFTSDMAGLHLLALLLTADQELASQCFVAGLEDSIHDNSVFRQWARSWSRRTIIKNAIKAVRPGEQSSERTALVPLGEGAGKQELVDLIVCMADLERFVFVMSVLEGFSASECASLLGCSQQAVVAARTQALLQLSAIDAQDELNYEVGCAQFMTELGAA